MHKLLPTLAALWVAFSPAVSLAQEQSAADKAAAAAQRAAEAAEKAADAAARSAAAVEKMTAAPAPAKPPESPKPAEPPAAAPPPGWTGVVGVSLIALSGNAQSLTFKGTGAFERKTESWIWGVKANAVYGQQQAAGATTSQVSAMAAGLELRGDRRFTEQLSAYLIGGIVTDHVASIEERPYAEVGAALIWFDTKEPVAGSKDLFDKTSLRTDLGFRYGHEYRFQYYPVPPDTAVKALPGVDIIAPHAGVAYRYAINKDIIFTEALDVVPNLVGDTRLLLTSQSKLAARLTAALSLSVGFGFAYDSVPAAGRKNTDTALSVGLEVGL